MHPRSVFRDYLDLLPRLSPRLSAGLFFAWYRRLPSILAAVADPGDWHTQETYKGLISLGQSALRVAAIINGGAAVAFLAFMGRFFDVEIGTAINLFWAIRVPMLCFILGLVIIGLASICAYIMQLRLYNDSMGRAEAIQGPPGFGQWTIRSHEGWLRWSISLVIGSYLIFAIGAMMAAINLT